jgi:putative nucleotidyltransferase with HDIG domain
VPGSLGHLTRRFFDVLFSAPLDAAERMAVEGWLDSGQAWVFFSQPDPDQRHGFHAALVVIAGGGDLDVIRAALLHDVGKRHARLGVVGRTCASLAMRLGLPLTGRWQLYRDHGETAARELDSLGCGDLIVDFARHHHGERPPGISTSTWDLLQLADQPPKTSAAPRDE